MFFKYFKDFFHRWIGRFAHKPHPSCSLAKNVLNIFAIYQKLESVEHSFREIKGKCREGELARLVHMVCVACYSTHGQAIQQWQAFKDCMACGAIFASPIWRITSSGLLPSLKFRPRLAITMCPRAYPYPLRVHLSTISALILLTKLFWKGFKNIFLSIKPPESPVMGFAIDSFSSYGYTGLTLMSLWCGAPNSSAPSAMLCDVKARLIGQHVSLPSTNQLIGWEIERRQSIPLGMLRQSKGWTDSV